MLLVAGLLTAFWIKSRKEYFSHDEFVTAVLVGHSSLPEMLDTIRNGGETNPPLYFILDWLVVRVCGTSEEAVRGLSAFSIALAAVVVFFTLRPVVEPRNAALAVAFVFGLSRSVFWFLVWARYYGLFVLLAAVMFFLFVRINTTESVRRRDVLFIFLVHVAMVYLHLFGLLFSGLWLGAQLVLDAVRGRGRWKIYGAVVAAWVTFLAWVPALPKQFYITSGGTWTPRMKFGLFVDELAMQTPLATVLLLTALLALVTMLAPKRWEAGDKTNARAATGLAALLLLALAWMAVPVATWAASQILKPVYLQRYVAPCVVSLAAFVGVGLWAIRKLPHPEPPSPNRVPAWLPGLVAATILGFCLAFQPLRAMQDAAKPAAAFTDEDFGHPNLPIVCEDSMDFLPRAHYGKGREYILLIDHEAAEKSAGYFTKQMERYYSRFRAHHPEWKIRYANELPAGPEGFLLVDVAQATTFEWVLKNRPGFTAELLGTWPEGQKVFLVRREERR